MNIFLNKSLNEWTNKYDKIKKEKLTSTVSNFQRTRRNYEISNSMCISVMDSAGGNSAMEHCDKSRPGGKTRELLFVPHPRQRNESTTSDTQFHW